MFTKKTALVYVATSDVTYQLAGFTVSSDFPGHMSSWLQCVLRFPWSYVQLASMCPQISLVICPASFNVSSNFPSHMSSWLQCVLRFPWSYVQLASPCRPQISLVICPASFAVSSSDFSGHTSS